MYNRNKIFISSELGVDRNTFRKYLQMDEGDFLQLIEQGRKLPSFHIGKKQF
jgi:hypothetical protein